MIIIVILYYFSTFRTFIMKRRTLFVAYLCSILQKILKMIIMSKKELNLLIAILLAGSFFVGCSKFESKNEERVILVKTMTVSPSNNIVGNSYVGLVEEELSTSLSFQSIGNIENIYVGEGQRVSKGQLLATLNKANLKSTHDMALSTLKRAKDGYERLKLLHDNGSLPEIKWVEIQTSLQQAISSEEIARKGLQNAELRAPYSGIISKKNAEVGSNVIMGMSVFTLVKTDNVKIKISIPEKEISKIKIGDPVSINVSALGNKVFNAKITEKGVAGDMLSHTYDARIKINNSNNELLPGMVCNVSILKEGETQNIVLPNSCIQIDNNDNKFVWIDKNGVAEKRIISTGGFVGDGVIVAGGLSEGDKVIIEGNSKVSQGMKISVK